MSYNYIQTVTIDLGGSYTNAPELGMYNNQLRYSERQLVGVTEQYASGYINTISTISQTATFEYGGSSASASGITVSLCNVNQLKYKLLAINSNITLKNLKITIHEFVGTDIDGDYISKDLIFVGLIDEANFTDTDLLIKASSTKISRKANMMHFLPVGDENIEIPITIGASNPTEGLFFKALRLNDTEEKITVEELAEYNNANYVEPYVNYYPPDMDQFFVSAAINEGVGGIPTRVFRIKLGYMDSLAIPSATYFVNKWVYVVAGAGQGEYAKIKYCTVKANGFVAEVEIELYEFLKTQWKGNATGTATNQTWVNIVKIDKSYRLDDFPCYGWFNANNQMISSQAELYIKDDNDVGKKLPDFGYDVNTTDANNCSLIINPRLFSEDTDSMSSYEFVPCRKYKYLDTLSDSTKNWTTIHGSLSGMNRVYQDGLFFDYSYIQNVSITSHYLTPINDSLFCDKNLDNYHEINMAISCSNQPGSAGFFKIGNFMTLELPRLEKDFTFDNIYLGVCTESWHTYTSGGQYGGSYDLQNLDIGYFCGKKKLIGAVENPIYFELNSNVNNHAILDNLPDFYIQRNRNNQFFYTESTNPNYLKTRYSMFDLKITSKEEYSNIYEIFFGQVFYGGLSNLTYTHNDTCNTYFRVKELFFIFETSASVKKEIYV